jgi:hypothetical protein
LHKLQINKYIPDFICLMLCLQTTSCFVYYSTLNMEAVCFIEMSVKLYRSTRRHIKEDCILHSRRYENLCKLFLYSKFCPKSSAQYG